MDDSLQLCEENINIPEISEQMYKHALKLIAYFESLDRLESRKRGVPEYEFDEKPKPTVLVFLPGIFEIKQMYTRLEEWVQL